MLPRYLNVYVGELDDNHQIEKYHDGNVATQSDYSVETIPLSKISIEQSENEEEKQIDDKSSGFKEAKLNRVKRSKF